MFEAIRLIPALQAIFRSGIEFTEESFAELNAAQQEAYERKVAVPDEPIFRVLPYEPTVIERQGNEKVTLELTIATQSERQLLLDAVQFIHCATNEMPEESTSFEQRLANLRQRLPPIVIGEPDIDRFEGG
ncbi:hypothetical protein Poly24_22820 [Rosistilla carotiformis]|uniref:Uncharacterized protein n=1 Tax=Rosistilla carotiformis TaxID=2528017 RepID=A0A518JSQ8_9BACT|nr:hypothetical protein [Rosistilla carotiformis]QDV68572.1 hypothetical protein Poly24_22820 [Rosistilla carotiformis]